MNISIKEMIDTDYDKAIEKLNFVDVDAEFLLSFKKREDNFWCVYDDKKLVGVVQIDMGKHSYLYIFIDPIFRGSGIGGKTLELCEDKLLANEAEQIMTTYRINNTCFKAFANKYGYIKKYASTYMQYTGERFNIPELPIRRFCNNDYDTAHKLYAKAFHEMRISVGDFPDSKIEQPSNKMRQYWTRTSNERLVYLQNDEIVGYAHIVGSEIGSVSVKTINQGLGIGRNFVKYISNKILEDGNEVVSLYCVVGNKAKRLYDSLGFKEVYTSEYAVKCIV